ncbi:hypothetical protein V8E53_013020 [Lactarius tabidus]
MWRRNYQPLPQDKSEEHINDAEHWDPVVRSNRAKTILLFGFVIIALCTALDIVLLISLGFSYAQSVWYPTDPAQLDTPSTYIKYDLLYRNGTKTNSKFPPLQGLPRALAQVSFAEPDKIFPQWPISIVVQFRVVDYGMENCGLVLRILEFGSEAMEIACVGSTIDVWSLAVDAKVELQTLSNRTLPRRIDRVGSFMPRYNTTEQLLNFTCESGTYHASLLACPQGVRKEDCWVDVTSTKEKPIGLYLVQHQTI